MKKKLIALFAACSMITTAVAGLVQTAYAAGPRGENVTITVSDGASDSEKILTFYYDNGGTDGMNAIQGNLAFTGGNVTINSITVTINAKYTGTDVPTGAFYFAEEADGGASSADGSFATVNITVPTDADITANFEVVAFETSDFDDFATDIGTVSVTIPKKSAPPTPSVTKSVENSAVFTEADGYDKNVVVGTIQLDVENTTIDLTKAEYEGKNPTKVEGYDNPTQFSGSALITVVINGATSEAALDMVVFN